MGSDPSAYDREVGKAEYILGELKKQIQVGTLPEQAKVPSERDLSEKYGVSRMTARRALQLLEGEGLVTRHPIRGTFVGGIRERQHEHHGIESNSEKGKTPIAAEELSQSRSFIKYMEYQGRTPTLEWLEPPAIIPADEEIAYYLQIPEDMLVLKRYRLQLADRLPYRVIESYYPADLFGELLTTDIGDKPLFDWLYERHGLSVERAREQLIARLPIPAERDLLQISPSAPVVDFHRTVWANSGRTVEWAHIIAVAQLYTFSYEYDIPRRH